MRIEEEESGSGRGKSKEQRLKADLSRLLGGNDECEPQVRAKYFAPEASKRQSVSLVHASAPSKRAAAKTPGLYNISMDLMFS